MELDVGKLDPRRRAHEGRDLELVGGAEPALQKQPLRPDQKLRRPVEVAVEGDRLAAAHLDVELQVVLQVRPDPGAVGDHRDPVLGEVRRRPDARQHQELRGVDRGGGEDHLPPRPNRLARAPAAHLDAGRPAVLDHHPLGEAAQHRDVRPWRAPGAGRRSPPTSAGPARRSAPSGRSLPAFRRCSPRWSRSPPAARPRRRRGRAGWRAARASRAAARRCRARPTSPARARSPCA